MQLFIIFCLLFDSTLKIYFLDQKSKEKIQNLIKIHTRVCIYRNFKILKWRQVSFVCVYNNNIIDKSNSCGLKRRQDLHNYRAHTHTHIHTDNTSAFLYVRSSRVSLFLSVFARMRTDYHSYFEINKILKNLLCALFLYKIISCI